MNVLKALPNEQCNFIIKNKIYFVIAGEWWNANVIDVENQGLATGAAPNLSDAYTINGWPGDLYPCSQNRN